LAKEVPHLIRDADSSQHSALIHALRGQSDCSGACQRKDGCRPRHFLP
jgi:hypothetical protein